MSLLLLGSACAAGGGRDEAPDGVAGNGSPGQGPGSAPPTAGNPFANADPTPASGAAGSAPVMPHGCNDLFVEFAPVIPTVLLLVDRSGSMWDSGYGGSPTRWQAVYDGIVAAGTGVVPELASEVRFGLMTYTGDGGSGMCPVLTEVAAAVGNAAAITQALDAVSERPPFKGETPTGAGVRAATQALRAVTDPGPKVIVLITDGEPDSCATPDPQCGQDESIAAVQAAFAEGIATFVIGISSDVGTQHLQDLANAGSGLPVRAPDMQYTYNCINPGYASLSATYAAAGATPGAAPVHQPGDRAAIAGALGAVIRNVHGCAFTLEGDVDLEQAHLGSVLLDTAVVPYDTPDGWRMNDVRTLELVGGACQRLQSEAQELVVSFPCEVIHVR